MKEVPKTTSFAANSTQQYYTLLYTYSSYYIYIQTYLILYIYTIISYVSYYHITMILLQMHSDHPISSHLSRLLVDIQNASSAGARSARAGQITSWAGAESKPSQPAKHPTKMDPTRCATELVLCCKWIDIEGMGVTCSIFLEPKGFKSNLCTSPASMLLSVSSKRSWSTMSMASISQSWSSCHATHWQYGELMSQVFQELMGKNTENFPIRVCNYTSFCMFHSWWESPSCLKCS